ncbi:hypothetical protein ACFQ0O_40100 [Saccharopolyspora spinosporotrichia]
MQHPAAAPAAGVVEALDLVFDTGREHHGRDGWSGGDPAGRLLVEVTPDNVSGVVTRTFGVVAESLG